MFDSRKYLSPEEDEHLSRLISGFDSRDKLMLGLLRKYGIRSSELLSLRGVDFSESPGLLRVTGLKGSNDREVPLFGVLLQRVRLRRLEMGADDLFFPISYNRLCEIWHLYRPCKKPLHSLRHTFAVEFYENTKDPLYLKESLGHKSLNSTLVYARVINKRLRDRRYYSGKA